MRVGLSSTDGLSTWPQQPRLDQPEARGFFQVSYIGAGTQGFGLSFNASPGTIARSWLGSGQGHKPAPLWDATIAGSGLIHYFQTINFKE